MVLSQVNRRISNEPAIALIIDQLCVILPLFRCICDSRPDFGMPSFNLTICLHGDSASRPRGGVTRALAKAKIVAVAVKYLKGPACILNFGDGHQRTGKKRFI